MPETILVVDDEIINRLVLTTMLKKNGYSILEAQNGEEALHLTRSEHPDIIILDIMMPKMDGYEVIEQLKKEEKTASIPIILVTALNSTEDIQRGIGYGVDEFITKPVDVNELIVRVRTILKIRSLNDFINHTTAFNERVEKLALGLNHENGDSGYDMDWIVSNILEVNLGNRHAEKGKPRYIYYRFNLTHFNSPPILLSKGPKGLIKKELPAEFDLGNLGSSGLKVEGISISTWRSSARSLEAYQSSLPPLLLAECGDTENFLYFEDAFCKIAFINYPRDIRPFDITWFRHILRYGIIIVSLMGKMNLKEKEYLSLVTSLSKIIEIKDEAKGRHQRMSAVAELLCRELSCSNGFTATLKDAIRLFDIGKIFIDQNILLKDRPLTDHERELIKRMPELAATILNGHTRLAVVKEIASGISENWDGSGYPDGLKGEEIPLSARIVAVINVYDSLRIQRSYRNGNSQEKSIRILRDGDDRLKPGKFDPRILDAFLRIEEKIKEVYI